MATEEIIIPDIGDFDSVDVIEIMVNTGDAITKEDSLITVESDKASMDIPATQDGIIKEIKIKVGDKVKQGSVIGIIDASSSPEKRAVIKKSNTVSTKKIEKLIPEPSKPAPEPPAKIQPKADPLPVGESALTNSDKSS
ncbi:MAG: biotin/lipoyl-containing protein, partial [Methylophilaceae bacterium]